MSAIMAVQLALFLITINALLALAASIAGSAARLFSGEQGALMPGGFLSDRQRVRRAIELQTVISRLAVITRLNLPLSSALEAAAVGETGRVRRTLQLMSQRIRGGASVSAALAAASRGCPAQLIRILERAEAYGQLTAALSDQERILDRLIQLRLTSTPHTRHALGYAAFMILFAVSMVFWFMAILMPKYKDIFLDFGVRLPTPTIDLAAASDWFVQHFWILPALLLLFAAMMMLNLLYATRILAPGPVAHLVASIRWAFPVTRTLDFGLGMAQAIRSMILGVRSGAPSAFSASLPSVVSATNHLRGRLAAFASKVSEGVAPYQAAQDTKLGGVLVCALRMVERGEDPERALGHAAEYYEAIAYRWWHTLSALSGPFVTLSLGVLVTFIALALFMPLIALINATAEFIQ